MKSDKFVRLLRGPVGSAKSSTCTVEALRMALAQEPNSAGIRKTRGVIFRNTAPMLRTTVLNTWRDWIPEGVQGFSDIRMHPPPFEQLWNFKLPDGTEVAAEIYFLALDTPQDIRKLLSLELTWGWGNEAREFPKAIIDALTQRLRRYPRMEDGGATRPGLILDTNAPDDDHWWPIMAGDVAPPDGMSDEEIRLLVKPDNWAFFSQPAGMVEVRNQAGKVVDYKVNPDAENIANLDPLYYSEMIKGKSKAWIDVYIMNRYGSTHDGRAVHPEFSRPIHVSPVPLQPWPSVPFILSFDFGLTPACLFRQKLRGRYQTLAEVVIADGGATKLASAVNRMMAERFPGFTIARGWGDPAGDQRSQADEKTPFQILRAANIPARPCETNDPELRRAASHHVYTTLVDGQPMELVDPSCKTYIAGMEGAFCYKRVPGPAEMFQDEPQKNRYSHICEAGEYGHVGEGEHRTVQGRKPAGQARVANVRSQADPLDRFAKARQARSNSAWSGRARHL